MEQLVQINTNECLAPKSQGDIKWIQEKSTTSNYGSNSQAKIHEESIKRARDLKRNELRWKLMQASQVQNQAKLKEIHTAVTYHKKRLSYAQDLASRLRTKYLRVVKSAKLTEEQYNKAKAQLSLQEKYVADEKMQLTKLAINCLNTGKQLFGDGYKLPENVVNINKRNLSLRPPIQAIRRMPDAISSTPGSDNLSDRLTPFLANARLYANKKPSLLLAGSSSAKKRKLTCVSRLSSLYDTKDSIFKNFASYRLTSKFAETGSPITDLVYCHNISSLEYVCLPDLLGECPDKSCLYQHRSNYYMTDLEKLADILSYKPSIAGFKMDPSLSPEENDKLCQIKLKQYAAKVISRNSNKSVEIIAKNLVKKIRFNESDMELLLKRRELPKMVHLKNPPPIECPCEIVTNSGTNGDKTPKCPEITTDMVSIKIEPIDPDECMTISRD